MANFNEGLVLKVRILFYILLIILSFFIFVAVAVMKDNALDRCPLYMEYEKLTIYYNGASSNCDYCVAVSVIFQLVFLLFRVISLILMLLGVLSQDLFLFSNGFELIYNVIEIVSCFLTLVSAFILTVGAYWDRPEGYEFDWETAAEVAQAGAWISFGLWLKVAVAGFLILWKSGRIPCLKGNQQEETRQQDPKPGEIIDPAAQRFRV